MNERSQPGTSTITRDGPCIVVHVPMKFKRRGGRKQIIVPGEGAESKSPKPPAQAPLIMAVVRGHIWRDLLEFGRAQTIAQIARANGVDGSYVSRMIDLTLLAPDIIRAIMEGIEPSGLSLAQLMGTQMPPTWDEQRRVLGFVP